MTKIPVSEFAAMFSTFTTSAFRLETLDRYSVEQEAEPYKRFLDGEPLPEDPNSEWAELVSAATAAGKTMTRVHLVPSAPTPYLRFEFEWFYPHNARAGEKIHILDRGTLTADDERYISKMPLSDFWLFDDEVCVRMIYDTTGAFIEPELVEEGLSEYRSLRDFALSRSITFQQYLASRRSA